MIDLSQLKVDELEQLKATIDAEMESRRSKLKDELNELLKNIVKAMAGDRPSESSATQGKYG